MKNRIINELGLYVWFEKSKDVETTIKELYALNISLEEDYEDRPVVLGLENLSSSLPQLVIVVKSESLGWYVGEVWSGLYSSEVWPVIHRFQYNMNTTCVCITKSELPPLDLIAFFKQASHNNVNVLVS